MRNWLLPAIIAAIGIGAYIYQGNTNQAAMDALKADLSAARKAVLAAQSDASAAEDAAASAAAATEQAMSDAAAMAEKAAKAEEAAAAAMAQAEMAKSAAAETADAEAMPMMPPFGSEHDVGYAGLIWKAMLAQKFAGPDSIHKTPYEGTEPHGSMLELFIGKATIEGQTGDLLVKRNYGPEGVTAEEVVANPEAHLGAITIMFKREAGFDEDTQNWFWTRFNPDGSVAKNPMGMALAGKVAKGMDQGCIACHASADGDDFVFAESYK